MTKIKKKIVIIGGGFGGCSAAKALSKQGHEITLIDKRNHHVFQPLLYQVATAQLSPAQIAYPIRAIHRKAKNITVLLGNVVHIDHEKRDVHLKRSNQTYPFDYLIVAAGARHSYFGNPQWEKHAYGLKTMRDALQIRERLLYSFEKAERTRFEDKQRKFSTVVIVGAGPTGVEMAGAIAELTQKTMAKEFKRFNTKSTRIVLVEGAETVLNRYPEKLSKQAEKDLTELGVELKLKAMVTNVDENGVQVGDEFIESENIIWAAGNTASPLIKSVTQHTNRMGQAEVNPDFSTKEDPNIFCIGDCASLIDTSGNPVPGVAQGALQAGDFVAKQIKRDIQNKDRDTFRYFNKGLMATIGRSRAVAALPGLQFSGFFAWILWGLIHVLFLVDFRNRLIVFMDWVNSYFTHKRAVRLINVYRELPDKKD